jgi:hypothetical protein
VKPRLGFFLFALLGIGLTAFEWYQVRSGHFYHPAAAVFGPLCAVLFGALAMFPKFAGRAGPEGKTKRNVQGVLLLFGLAVGLFNWYAMTHF